MIRADLLVPVEYEGICVGRGTRLCSKKYEPKLHSKNRKITATNNSSKDTNFNVETLQCEGKNHGTISEELPL